MRAAFSAKVTVLRQGHGWTRTCTSDGTPPGADAVRFTVMRAIGPRRHGRGSAEESAKERDQGEARLWHIGTALSVSFMVAVIALVGLGALAWLLLGLAGFR